MEESVVYGLWCICHSDAGIRYIGLTTNQRGYWARHGDHLSEARTGGKRPVSRWIRKHGEENIVMSILEVCTLDDLNQREMAWIAAMRESGRADLNVTDGGEGVLGYKMTPAQLTEMSKRVSGELHPNYGKPLPESTRRKIGEAHRGRTLTEDHKSKLSESHMGNRSGRSKLTDDQVMEIHQKILAGDQSHGSIARDYGVSRGVIDHIKSGYAYSRVTGIDYRKNKS
jgi:group I intron endonuclease